jgi:hypothetical protein
MNSYKFAFLVVVFLLALQFFYYDGYAKGYEKGSNTSLQQIDSLLHQKVIQRRLGDTTRILNLQFRYLKEQDTVIYYIN